MYLNFDADEKKFLTSHTVNQKLIFDCLELKYVGKKVTIETYSGEVFNGIVKNIDEKDKKIVLKQGRTKSYLFTVYVQNIMKHFDFLISYI